MSRRTPVAWLSALLVVLVPCAVAPSAHGRHHDAWWEDWRPAPQDETYADEAGLAGDDGAWFDDVQDSGDALPGAPPAPERAPAREPSAPAPAARGLPGLPYRSLILRHARAQRLDAAFVAAIIRAESGFNPRARSPVGARGLMQLMPATARGMGARVDRLYDPATSIRYGTRYLAHVRAVVGRSTKLIAAGYNAGPGAVRRFGGVPPYGETQAYVRRVAAFHAAYRGR